MRSTALSVPAVLDSLQLIATFVTGEAAAAGLGADGVYRLRLAIDELATNIILYAYPGDPGTIDLRAEMGGETLALTIEDTGVPFDPRRVPPPDNLHASVEDRQPGGLGVFLALRSVDAYDYERADGRNRSTVVMNRPEMSPR